ncbi:MAG: DUF4203 domain-containing protein [Deltaproteobacteria bacterium]|nr:DUF4203 domain-containing protein [Deltaproteobacteria bacterium]
MMNISAPAIPIIVIGALICVAGWHLFNISVKIIGFILGASVGYALGVFVLKAFGTALSPTFSPWVPFLSAALMGIVGILLVKTLIKSILFIAGLFFGIVIYSLCSGLMTGNIHPFGMNIIIENISIWSLATGVAFGILFIFFEKWFVILYTSAVGAYLIMTQLHAPLIIFYGLMVLGGAIQLWMSKGAHIKGLQTTRSHANS